MSEYRSQSSAKDQEEQFLRQRIREIERIQEQQNKPNQSFGWYEQQPQPPYAHVPEPPFMNQKPPRKSKFVAVLFSFLFPGAGHFYLGLMQRGLLVMMLIALDIVAIVYFTSNMGENVPLIVLLGLFLPVIYFFNLFDAMQHTDRVNTQAIYGNTEKVKQGPWLGVLLVIIGLVMLLFTIDPNWLRWMFKYAGSFAGAAVLIAGGLYLLFKESRKK
ncbi:DUF6677 family protein [Paenibacillus taiwanensis]|uniref:DUF6677 family protein n=1 Tax=Paenibacillus taiwanensis TaxID=401638 RepID=UPI000427F239|nr:DUF6677 family protein [Paenibacillus taiwanensis]